MTDDAGARVGAPAARARWPRGRRARAALVVAVALVAPAVAVLVPPAPAGASSFDGVTAIAAGSNHSLAVRTDGTAWAWGHNDHGQLGDGTTTDRLTPCR